MLSDPQLSSLAMDPPAGSAPRPNDDEQPAKGEHGARTKRWAASTTLPLALLAAGAAAEHGATQAQGVATLCAIKTWSISSLDSLQHQRAQLTWDTACCPAAPRRGLFACFARPAVKLADPEWSHNGSVRSVHERGKRSASARGGSSRSCAGLAERGSRSVHAGLSSSLGGSERSVRSGAPRDPSVRSGRRATSVQLIYEGDSALWTPAELGRAPSLGQAGSTRSSNSSVHRASPRSLADGLYSLLGHSVASMTSGAPGLHQGALKRTATCIERRAGWPSSLVPFVSRPARCGGSPRSCHAAEEDIVEVAPQRSPRLVRALSVQISPAEPLRRADIA